MKVARWYNNRDIRIEEVAVPEPGPGELLAKVMACGICGSDVVEWYRLPRAPLVPGHEIGAQVAAVGSAVSRFRPGDRVFIAPKVPCGACSYCRNGHDPVCSDAKDRLPGGFAEYVLVPASIVQNGTYPLPDAMTYEQATFIEPLACVVRAQRLAGLEQGQTLLVMGCGMSGLLHIRLAAAAGCSVIATDINRQRLGFARKSGADPAIEAAADVPTIIAARGRKPADVVMLCTSSLAAVAQAWKSVDKGGAVVFFAVPDPGKEVVVPINAFWMQEIRILTSYYCGPPDIRAAIDLIADGKIAVDDLISHILPLTDIARGYQLVADGTESIKVIIRPSEFAS